MKGYRFDPLNYSSKVTLRYMRFYLVNMSVDMNAFFLFLFHSSLKLWHVKKYRDQEKIEFDLVKHRLKVTPPPNGFWHFHLVYYRINFAVRKLIVFTCIFNGSNACCTGDLRDLSRKYISIDICM